MRRLRLGLAFCALTALAIVGCGGSSGPKLYSVTGQLVSGGTPIEGANVSFNPVEANMPSSSGVTDKDGRFTMRTGQGPLGAVAGKHKVTVAPPVSTDAYKTPGQDPRANDSVVPQVWLTTTTTPKEVTVEKKSNDFTIDLAAP